MVFRIVFLKDSGRGRVPVVQNAVVRLESTHSAVGYPHRGVGVRVLLDVLVQPHPIKGFLVLPLKVVGLLPFLQMAVSVVENGHWGVCQEDPQRVVLDLVHRGQRVDPLRRSHDTLVPEIFSHRFVVIAETVEHLHLVFPEIGDFQIVEIFLAGIFKKFLFHSGIGGGDAFPQRLLGFVKG